MTKSCIITGKKVSTGYNVSHSNVKTKRILRPNLQHKRLVNPKTGRMLTVLISTRGLRTLKKWDREGKAYDLNALKKAQTLA